MRQHVYVKQVVEGQWGVILTSAYDEHDEWLLGKFRQQDWAIKNAKSFATFQRIPYTE
jgi:hypothetical protein